MATDAATMIPAHRSNGFTWIEVLTAVVVLVVLVAVAIPLSQSWQLRARRGAAVGALLAVQAAQDKHFAANAFYADDSHVFADPPTGLGLKRQPADGHFTLQVERSADELGYVASAVSADQARKDARCQQFRLDEHGRRWALDAEGKDSTADCWSP